MALPLVVFFFLIIVAVVLFVFGMTRYSVGAGFSFVSLSGVFFILTGLLLWTGGLQTNTLTDWDTNSDTTITANYQLLTFDNNPEIQILAYFFTFGGFFPVILAIRNVFAYNTKKKLEDAEYSY